MSLFFKNKNKKQSGQNNIEYWETLYTQYHDKIYRTVYIITTNKEITEDAVQEAFYKAFSKLGQLKEKEKFGSWIMKIAVNTAKDLLRKHSRQVPSQKVETIIDMNNFVNNSNNNAFSMIELKDEVDQVLSQMKPEHNQILTLRYHDDLSIKEIANVLSLEPATVKTRLHRAKRDYIRIAEELEEKGDLSKASGGEQS